MSKLTRAVILTAGLAILTGCVACGSRGAAHQDQPNGTTAAQAKVEQAPGGLSVTGTYGLTGHITRKPDAPETWVFHGTFEFPTAGYEAGEPTVTLLKSMPEQVVITIPVVPPPPDAMVAQVITEVPVEATGQASAQALFRVRVSEPAMEND